MITPSLVEQDLSILPELIGFPRFCVGFMWLTLLFSMLCCINCFVFFVVVGYFCLSLASTSSTWSLLSLSQN